MTRLIDRGAVFAGWVGLGMALVVVIAVELIIAVQSLVFLLTPLVGALIGVYANTRAERRRPARRVLANALYAGIVTGIGLALLYGSIRLLFFYGDTGSRPDGSQIPCRPGADCVYQRYVDQQQGDALAAVGITDAASLEAAFLREQVTGAGVLVGLAAAGAAVGGIGVALRGRSDPAGRPESGLLEAEARPPA